MAALFYAAVMTIISPASYAAADSGIPVLYFLGLDAWYPFVAVVLLEACFFIRSIGVAKSIGVSLLANLISTIIGFPLAQVLLLIAQVAVQLMAPYSKHPEEIINLFQFGLLSPENSPLGGYSIFVAAMLLMIPAYIVSVISETWMVRWISSGEIDPRKVRNANIASYLLILIPYALYITVTMISLVSPKS